MATRRAGGAPPFLDLQQGCAQHIAVEDYTPGPATVTNDIAFQYNTPSLPDDDHVSKNMPSSPTVSRRSSNQGSIRSRTSYSSRRDEQQDTTSRRSIRSQSPDRISSAGRRSPSISSRISSHRRSPSNLSVTSVMSLTNNIRSLTRELPEPTVFVQPPRKGLACTLCHSIFQDPVLVKCGHTFCRKCILGLPQGSTCPHSKHKDIVIPKTNLITNISIEEELAELDIYCKYGVQHDPDGHEGEYVVDPDGCQEIIKMGDREQHELHCGFRTTHCPHSSVCGSFKLKNLDAHLEVCCYWPCKHSYRGCQFIGTKAAVEDHLQTCKFEVVKEMLSESETRIQSLSEALESKDQEIEYLKSLVANMTERMENMEATFSAQIHQLNVRVGDNSEAVAGLRYDMEGVHNKIALVDQLQDAQATSHVFKCIGTFVGHQGPVWALVVYDNVLFSGSSDETVKVWDTRSTASFKVRKTLQSHRGIVHALCTHKKMLYSGSHDCTINVWDIESLTLVDTLIGHDNPVCTLAIANDYLFSGSLKVVNIWDLDSRTLVGCLSGFNHWVRALVATPEYLFAGSYQMVSIWSSKPEDIQRAFNNDTEPESLEQLTTTDEGSIYSVCLTDRYIIAGTYEHLIHLWDGTTLEEVTILKGHSGTVYALAVMPGSGGGRDRLFSASYDRTIRVWCLEQFTCLQILARHENSVDALAIHRGWLFSGAADSNIKVWQ